MIYKFNKYRDKHGYIKLEEIKKEPLLISVHGSRKDKEWFLIDGEYYLFKGNNGPLEEIKELINELMARQLGIENAQYDAAIYQGRKGVLTLDFTKGKIVNPMLNYLCEINILSNDLYTYVVFLCSRGISEEKIKENIKFWLYSHILDIFTCQKDRHFKNLSLFDDTLSHTPRYDSAGSFLSITNYSKMYNFVSSDSKDILIERYRGARTKFRIFPGDVTENSIDELLSACFVPRKDSYIFNLIKEVLLLVPSMIKTVSQMDFSSLFYELSEVNIILSDFYKDYFELIFKLRIEEYEKKEEVMKKSLNI